MSDKLAQGKLCGHCGDTGEVGFQIDGEEPEIEDCPHCRAPTVNTVPACDHERSSPYFHRWKCEDCGEVFDERDTAPNGSEQ